MTVDLASLFESFRSTAFRFECLPAYAVTEDEEAQAFRLWLAGEQLPQKEREWPKLCASVVAAQKSMQRVRLVTQPLSDYLRFEMEWGYPANVAAGEDIHILDHEPAGLLKVDFWLFDDTTAVVLEYDDDGRFIRPVVAKTVEPYRQARDLALRSAIPFATYVEQHGKSVSEFFQYRLNEPGVIEQIATLALRQNK
jgi:hypothetical protein